MALIECRECGGEGACVVIELKRGSNKLHMLQAISYAGMISAWLPEDLESLLDEDRQEALADFLESGKEDINRQQRIILIAEGYDYALLAGAEWLSDQFGVGDGRSLIRSRRAVSRAHGRWTHHSQVPPPPPTTTPGAVTPP